MKYYIIGKNIVTNETIGNTELNYMYLKPEYRGKKGCVEKTESVAVALNATVNIDYDKNGEIIGIEIIKNNGQVTKLAEEPDLESGV